VLSFVDVLRTLHLGKTIQALALIACYEQDWPVLILVPTSLRDAWETALKRRGAGTS
jgi:SNF2 family DNA or RNA helicase